MLIRADGIGIADLDYFPGSRRSYTVGDDPVRRKIPAADYVSCPGSGYCHAAIIKEALAIAVGHQLRTALAVGVGIVPVQRLVFPIAPAPLVVLIYLIRCHIDKGPDASGLADCLQNVYRTHHIGFIGGNGVTVALQDQRLGRQVKYYFRTGFFHCRKQLLSVPDISLDPQNLRQYAAFCQQSPSLGRRRFKRITADFCSGQ